MVLNLIELNVYLYTKITLDVLYCVKKYIITK